MHIFAPSNYDLYSFPLPDSLLAFAKVLKKFQDYTLPSGDAMLQKWIGKLKVFNKHLKAGDFKALGKAGHETSIILRALLPAIPDKIVHSAIESIPEMFEKQYESALNDGTSTLADVNRFVKFVAETMLTAMSKAKPTAETLN